MSAAACRLYLRAPTFVRWTTLSGHPWLVFEQVSPCVDVPIERKGFYPNRVTQLRLVALDKAPDVSKGPS